MCAEKGIMEIWCKGNRGIRSKENGNRENGANENKL